LTLKSSIQTLMLGENLSSSACRQALEEMLDPGKNPLQIAAFLVLLRAKHETADELAAIVGSLRDRMIVVPVDYPVLDIVGTGGDGFNTVNISTGGAILAASCGVKVAKHGNRSVSSLAGSADVLEALGVNIQMSPGQIAKSIDRIGIGFCFAPNFHPVTQALGRFRKELNVPTTFNILGPLLNPAKAAHLIMGVHDETLLPVIADVLIQVGSGRSVIVHGMGLDEISCAGPTRVIEINGSDKLAYVLDPLEFGLPGCSIEDLRGGDAKVNARLLADTLNGRRGPIADTLALNAAVALYAYGAYPSIAEALPHAMDNLRSGAAWSLLNDWIRFSHEQPA
jgi:anthranilate phosphoribosyltransferase